jgi:hypothetical protein
MAPSDFFLFGQLKGDLASPSIGKISEFFERFEEILSVLTTETIARVFSNWDDRLKHVIDTYGEDIGYRTQ